MHYLITGGTGFIGSAIINTINPSNDLIVAISRNETVDKNEGVIYLNTDVTDLNEITKICNEYSIDGVVHTAGVMHVKNSIESTHNIHKINENGTFNVLEAAVKSSVKKVIISSSASVYGNINSRYISEKERINPISYYGFSKHIEEEYAKTFNNLYGISTISLRFFNIYGPGQSLQSENLTVIPRFINTILRKREITITGNGNQTRDFVYIEDVANACISALKSKTEGIFNIGSGKSTSLNQLIKIIQDNTRITVPIKYIPANCEDIKHSCADISLAKKSFGFFPKTEIETGIKNTIKYYEKMLMNDKNEK